MSSSAVFPALALLLSLSAPSTAQTPFYDVASIKPNQNGGRSNWGIGPGGRLTATNVTLKHLLEFAWNLRDYQIAGGPAWTGSEGFDIVATPNQRFDPTPETIDTGRQMLQKLLTDNFGLVVRHETKDLPIYFLVVAKNGLKMQPVAKWERPTDMRAHCGPAECVVEKMNMNIFTQQALRDIVGRPIVDKTGLDGYYDFKLEWTPDQTAPAAPGDNPDIFTALQEQLGLRLEPQKGPVDVLTIVEAQKPAN